MTAIAAELPPVDSCPDCPAAPACLPLSYMDLPGGTIAAYWHRSCGMAWATWFCPLGWPVGRSVAPAEPSRRAA